MANQKTRAKKKANKAQKNQADNDATATATVVRAPLARLASSELNQRNGQAQARPKAMARRHRGKRQDETQSDESVPSYGMKESRQRLESRGFHPSVTDMTPYQAIDAWNGAMDEHEKRPTLQELSQGPYNFQDQLNSYTFRILTRASLIFRLETQAERSYQRFGPSGDGPIQLVHMIEHPDLGERLATAIFSSGLATAQNLALTCSRMWRATAHSVRLWDMNGGWHHDDGTTAVFVAVNPEYTVTEMKDAQLRHSNLVVNPDCTASNWVAEPIRAEVEAIDRSVLEYRKRTKGVVPKFWKQPASDQDERYPFARKGEGLLRTFEQVVPNLRKPETFGNLNQFAAKEPSIYKPKMAFSLDRLCIMTSKIYERRGALEVLHLERIELLDRRVLAVLLRGLPKLRVLGVYGCPLIHFGDVIPLLDLIHEVNGTRRSEGQSEIEGLDFSPRFHAGQAFNSDDGRRHTCGITWASHGMTHTQRGVFAILMRAYLKAESMKLGLLFDKTGAFMRYLSRLPFPPLAIPSFLSALRRFLDLAPGVQNDAVRQMDLFDMMKPVMVGAELSLKTIGAFTQKDVGLRIFCNSCGCKMLNQFFTEPDQLWGNEQYRRCAGCKLSMILDEEHDHMKRAKLAIVDDLFPQWDQVGYNVEAPMPLFAKRVMEKTSKPREHRSWADSLQGLGTLKDLYVSFQGPLRPEMTRHWAKAELVARWADLYRFSMRAFTVSQPGFRVQNTPEYRNLDLDAGRPDCIEEMQPRRERREKYSPQLGPTSKSSRELLEQEIKWGW